MAVKMNLWSMTLLPGEKYPLYIRKDFQITNAALAEELASKDGRSVVKVTHNPINPALFDEDSDSEFDEEMDDEFELGSDEDEEMEGDDEDADAQEKAEKVAADEEDDDEDEDEEDDEEDDDEDEVEETTVICSLTAGKIEQASLNLTFVEGEVVMFEVTGDNAVHLLGNYINQFPEDNDSDSEYDSEEDDYSDFDEDEELDSDEEEAVANVISKPKAKITEISESKPAAADPKKRKAETLDSPASKPAAAAPAASAAATADGELTKTQKKKLAKKQKLENGSAAPAASAAAAPKEAAKEVKKDAGKPSKKTLPSGLVIEDVKVGNGPVAKTGKKLGMRYIGKLDNGKQFDANTSGKPFTFNLGRGEVISGWDQGLVGMAVGGERRLTIPPQLAYGNQKIPGIPKNSTLTFEVKLVSIN